MRRTLYRWYRRTWALLKYRRDRLTPPGTFLLALFPVALFFGLNSQKTMIFPILALFAAILLISRFIERRFRPDIVVSRLVPRYASVGLPLRYRVDLRNKGPDREAGLSAIEESHDPRPTYDEWIMTPEPGEEKRNRFDRYMRYYRWEWLIGKRSGALFQPIEIPALAPGENAVVEAVLTPNRRGVLRLDGVRIERPDLFGLWKRGVVVPAVDQVIVLPPLYPVTIPEFCGHRRYNRGGIVEARKVGESEEFMQVREYRPGDPLKKIHWRSSARTGTLAVKEFQDEYFARIGLVLDTFRPESFSPEVEEAISIAASYLVAGTDGDELIDLMFVGSEAFSFSTGRGMGSTERMLEILAGVEPCRDKEFPLLERILLERLDLLCGAVIILTDYDEARARLLGALAAAHVDQRVLLVTTDPVSARRRIADAPLPVRIVEVGAAAEALR